MTNIPATMIPVTLIDLAERSDRAEQALDSALRLRKPPVWLQQHFLRWSMMGAGGATTMLELLESRMGKRLPRSWFQRLAKQVSASKGIALEDEWPVFDLDGKQVAELDLANVDLKVGVECQSISFHAFRRRPRPRCPPLPSPATSWLGDRGTLVERPRADRRRLD